MSWISSILAILGGWLGLQKGKQDRYNAPDMVGNKAAETDLKEREQIERDVEESDRAGQVSDKERRDAAE